MISTTHILKSGGTIASAMSILVRRGFVAFVVVPATIASLLVVGSENFDLHTLSTDFAQYIATTGTGDQVNLRVTKCADPKVRPTDGKAKPTCSRTVTQVVSVDNYARDMAQFLKNAYLILATFGVLYAFVASDSSRLQVRFRVGRWLDDRVKSFSARIRGLLTKR